MLRQGASVAVFSVPRCAVTGILARLKLVGQNNMEPMVSIALKAARKAGDMMVRAADELDRLPVDSKGTNDFVSEVDRNSEREIIYLLQKTYPDHAFIGEESGRSGPENADYVWIIDPLDGTTNYLRGIPHYAISLACLFKGRLEHACIVNPVLREEFTASRGRGAQFNGRRMRVSNALGLESALIGTGIPFKGHCEAQLPAYASCLAEIAGRSAGIRRAGAASLDLAYVAAGRLDAFWEIGLSSWDMAAGALLVKEAGGLVGDFEGGERYLDSGNIVAGNPRSFKAVLQIVGSKFKAN